jgi:hypothetical protein
MAEEKGNTALPQNGDRDRVAMLSIRADGTPDQHNPEIIGDREFAEQATRQQFREQAVSAVDTQKRRELFGTGAGGDEPVEQDPKIQELQDAHESAEKAAEKAADSTVGALFAEEQAAPAAPAGDSAPKKVTRSASAK